MKSTKDFAQASPRMKPVMIYDGYAHLSEQFFKLSKEVKVLNGWLTMLPGFIELGKSHPIDLGKLSELIEEVENSHDQLSAQFVEHAQVIEKILKSLTSNQKS